MADITVQYLGKLLRSPIVAGSSDITHSLDKIIELDKKGVGAVVVKSLFEESIEDEKWDDSYRLDRHAEEADYAAYEIEKLYGSKDYLKLLTNAKKEISVPVIASINCTSEKWWGNYAEQVEKAGADAIELNIAKINPSVKTTAEEIENIYFDVVRNVKSKVNIPVSVKIGNNFTSIPNFVKGLQKAGANAAVMFNFFSEPDINLNKMELRSAFKFSTNGDYRTTLRWIGLIYDEVNIELSATTGVKNYEDVLKLVLSGASTVQIASVLYQDGFDVIEEMNSKMKEWLDSKKFVALHRVKGYMSYHNMKGDERYLWNQYLKKRIEH